MLWLPSSRKDVLSEATPRLSATVPSVVPGLVRCASPALVGSIGGGSDAREVKAGIFGSTLDDGL